MIVRLSGLNILRELPGEAMRFDSEEYQSY
jgi:hypothetical protein